MENIEVIFFPVSVIVLFIIGLYLIPIGLWFSALVAGVRISLMELLLMRLRRSPVKDVVMGLITSTKGGLSLSRDELEALALSGGNIRNVVNGMIAAKRAGFSLSFQNAMKSDAQGIDILSSVKDKLSKTQEVKFE